MVFLTFFDNDPAYILLWLVWPLMTILAFWCIEQVRYHRTNHAQLYEQGMDRDPYAISDPTEDQDVEQQQSDPEDHLMDGGGEESSSPAELEDPRQELCSGRTCGCCMRFCLSAVCSILCLLPFVFWLSAMLATSKFHAVLAVFVILCCVMIWLFITPPFKECKICAMACFGLQIRCRILSLHIRQCQICRKKAPLPSQRQQTEGSSQKQLLRSHQQGHAQPPLQQQQQQSNNHVVQH
jgi:hypothetical protein